jgi:hypothetical protein
MKKVNSREFIIDSTSVTAGAAGAVTFGNKVLLSERALVAKEKFLETHCGTEDAKRNRALIDRASHSGNTGKVAGTIGRRYAKAEWLMMGGWLNG